MDEWWMNGEMINPWINEGMVDEWELIMNKWMMNE